MISILTFLLLICTQAPADDFVPGGITDERLAKIADQNRRAHYLDWREQIVKRYNRLLNRIGDAQRIGSGERKSVDIPKSVKENLSLAQDTLVSTAFLRTLKKETLTKVEVDAISQKLDRAEDQVAKAEEAWEEENGVETKTSESLQASSCKLKALQEVRPVDSGKVKQIEQLIENCIEGSRYSSDGVKVLVDPDTSVPRAIRIDSSMGKNAKADSAPLSNKASPTPTPKPKKLDDPYNVALRGAAPDIPPQKPRAHTAIVKQAIDAVKGWKKGDSVPLPMGDFWLEAEADAMGKDGADKLARTRAEWKTALEKYSKELGAMPDPTPEKKIFEFTQMSHSDYWKDYSAEKPELSDLMLYAEGNCEARARFLVSMIQALQLQMPKNKKLLIQFFEGDDASVPEDKRRAGHIQAVVYDEKSNLVWDPLQGGRPTKGTPVPLFDPMVMLNQYVIKEAPGSARPFEDFQAVAANAQPGWGKQIQSSTKASTKSTKFSLSVKKDNGLALPGPKVGIAYSRGPNPDSAVSDSPSTWDTRTRPDFGDDGDRGYGSSWSTKELASAKVGNGKEAIQVVQTNSEYRYGFFKNKDGSTSFETDSKYEWEKLSKAKNRAEFERLALGFAMERDSKFPPTRAALKKVIDFAKDPERYLKTRRDVDFPALLVPDIYDFGKRDSKLSPQERREIIKKNFPLLDEALKAKDQILQRFRAEPYAFAKLISETDVQNAKKSFARALEWLDEVDNADISRPNHYGGYGEPTFRFRETIYKVLLDPKVIAWSEKQSKVPVDLKKSQELPDTMGSHGWVPTERIYIKDPLLIGAALTAPTIDRRLHDKAIAALLDKEVVTRVAKAQADYDFNPKEDHPEIEMVIGILGISTRAYLRDLPSDRKDCSYQGYPYHTVGDKEGKPDTYRVYSKEDPEYEGNDEDYAYFGCLSRELALLQRARLKLWIEKYPRHAERKNLEIPIGKNGSRIITRREMYDLLDRQLEGKPLPSWFEKIPLERDPISRQAKK